MVIIIQALHYILTSLYLAEGAGLSISVCKNGGNSSRGEGISSSNWVFQRKRDPSLEVLILRKNESVSEYLGPALFGNAQVIVYMPIMEESMDQHGEQNSETMLGES